MTETLIEESHQVQDFNDINLKNALLTNIEFLDGTKTQIVTIFNNELTNFEEIKIGVYEGINRENIFYSKKMKTLESVCGNFKNGKFKPVIKYPKHIFTNN